MRKSLTIGLTAVSLGALVTLAGLVPAQAADPVATAYRASPSTCT